jgi:two-component system heavy metal sensor histidine kinase CusS
MQGLSIRWKLTLWYGAVLAAVLAAFSTVVFLTMRHQLLGRVDQGLTEELADVLFEVHRASDDPGLAEWLERRFARHEGFDFQVTRPGGERFFVNQRLGDTALPIPKDSLAQTPSFEVVTLKDGRRWRIVGVKVQGPSSPLIVQVARSLASFDQECRELLFTFVVTGPLTLLVAVGGGYFLARRALAPVEQITRTADEITADRLNRRVEVPNPRDEMGGLAGTLNRMIGRLERSFAEMQRFTADAAHELRTPLAVLRNEIEVALRAPRSPEEYGRVLENLLEEVNRLSLVAEQLLFLCRQDAGLHPAAQDEVAAEVLLQEVVGNMRLVAEEKGVGLDLKENDPCSLVTDPRQLRRVLYNLLDNAIKYTGPVGRVTVSGMTRDRVWSVTIADTGVGIPPEHLPHVFERFYRVDAARSGDGNGAGLGLAICQSIMTALGGAITLQSAVCHGTNVRVEVPVRRERGRKE